MIRVLICCVALIFSSGGLACAQALPATKSVQAKADGTLTLQWAFRHYDSDGFDRMDVFLIVNGKQEYQFHCGIIAGIESTNLSPDQIADKVVSGFNNWWAGQGVVYRIFQSDGHLLLERQFAEEGDGDTPPTKTDPEVVMKIQIPKNARISSLPLKDLAHPSYTRPLKKASPAMYGDDVFYIQSLLLQHGNEGIGEIDGWFGSKTDDAVRKFQDVNNLAADGIVGAKTWKELEF